VPKNINLRDLKYNNSYVKDIFNLSIPTTFSRLIGNIGYFFEPIIISFILGNVTKEYGALNGYVIPILFLPSFFTTAISQALIPVISNSYVNKRYKYMKSKLKLALFISLMIGIIFTIIFYMYPKELLLLLYKTDSGYKYLKFMSLFFLFYYIELPVSFALGAMGFARETLRCTIYSVFLKNILLIIFCYIYKFDGVMIATCFNILFQTFYNLYILKAKVNYLR
jgi:stage V sporulation protein B